jgi:cohesin complex subunit SA-1/2
MDLHILFCPSTTAGPDGKELEAAPISLTLDDEVQYRCAGFIQAEIERFKEHLEEMYPSFEDDQGSEGSDGEGSETEVLSKKTKKGKGKKQKDKLMDVSKCIVSPMSQLCFTHSH